MKSAYSTDSSSTVAVLAAADNGTPMTSASSSPFYQDQTAVALNSVSSGNVYLLVIGFVIIVGFVGILAIHKRMDNKEDSKTYHDYD